ncbi:MAG: Crp/Fnr family transcriptional regulator [Pseudomonadota bacterium]
MQPTERELIDSGVYDRFLVTWQEQCEKQPATITLPKDRVIITEGDSTDGLYIIVRGRVKIYVSDESGKEMILAIRGSGEYLGEIASLDGEKRTASVRTIEETEVYQISQEEFREFLAKNPQLSFEIIQLLTRRIRDFASSLRNLAFKSVYGRIIEVLKENSELAEDGVTRVVTTKFTQQNIADMVGSSREMVSRVLSELVKGEYISIENKIISIHKNLPKGW